MYFQYQPAEPLTFDLAADENTWNPNEISQTNLNNQTGKPQQPQKES